MKVAYKGRTRVFTIRNLGTRALVSWGRTYRGQNAIKPKIGGIYQLGISVISIFSNARLQPVPIGARQLKLLRKLGPCILIYHH